MAPQKAVTVSAGQQQQHSANGRHDKIDHNQAAVKPRKRKGKQNSSNTNGHDSQHQPSREQKVTPANDTQRQTATIHKVHGSVIENVPQKQQHQLQPLKNGDHKKSPLTSLSSIELMNNSNNNQRKFMQRNDSVDEDRNLTKAGAALAKQISADDTDDIDTGIEIDGSSNSGSSIKDMADDGQTKSTSVSPVMAQSCLVNDGNTTKHAAEVGPIEQMTGSLCTDVSSDSKKVGKVTKQQLAANQQRIDADEQLLQQKLQDKQRKSSLQDSSVSNTRRASLNTTTTNSTVSANNNPQSPSLCKVCDQHVYQMERVLAEKSIYHKRCFRCHQCKIQLTINNYSSHEGQVYCKAHHRQIFQPQVKLDSEDDVDIVAKSNNVVDDYLLHRGRLSELSFSFLQPKAEGIRKRQMIICENEPIELPKDVVRSDTKVDDGISALNLNLNNILEKFERGSKGAESDSQSSSPSIIIDKPSFDIKKTLKAFETKSLNPAEGEGALPRSNSDRPVVKKLTNLNGFLIRQTSEEDGGQTSSSKPLAVRRSESLMMRLKKYESRIAGEQINDDEDSVEDDLNNNERRNGNQDQARSEKDVNQVPKNLTSVKLSALKSQWENGDIKNSRIDDLDDLNDDEANVDTSANGDNCNGNSPLAEKMEELHRVRELARRRLGESGSSIKNIYENAIKEAQQQQQASRRNSSDLLALNSLSRAEIQQQLLQNGSSDSHNNVKSPATSEKDHFQLNLSNRANKLKAKFEKGLVNLNSHDDSDQSDGESSPALSKLEQIRQEKLEDLSIFTEGEIRAREARSMFQQIDRRLSGANSNGRDDETTSHSRPMSSVSLSMQAKILGQSNDPRSGGRLQDSNIVKHRL